MSSALDRMHSLLKELQPYDIQDSDRIRIGTDADGGYVLLNRRLEDINVLYSYGVAENSDFEEMFCKKLVQVNNKWFYHNNLEMLKHQGVQKNLANWNVKL